MRQIIWSAVKGLIILVDDDVFVNIVEGQRMQIEAKIITRGSHSGRKSSLDSADEVPVLS